MAYWLRLRGTHFPIRHARTVIGRSAYCSIVVGSTQASREHCALVHSAEGLLLSDLSSRNGTFVNGQRVTGARLLVPGDVILVGGDTLLVVEQSGRNRVSTNPNGKGDDFDTTTASGVSLLELLEEMSFAHPAPGAVESAFAAMEHGLETMLTGARQPDSTEAERIAEIVSRVAAWFPDGCKDGWRDAVRTTLAEGRS